MFCPPLRGVVDLGERHDFAQGVGMKQRLNMLAQNAVTGDLLAAVLEVRAGTRHAVGLIGLAALGIEYPVEGTRAVDVEGEHITGAFLHRASMACIVLK